MKSQTHNWTTEYRGDLIIHTFSERVQMIVNPAQGYAKSFKDGRLTQFVRPEGIDGLENFLLKVEQSALTINQFADND